jgi:hypothetical protein
VCSGESMVIASIDRRCAVNDQKMLTYLADDRTRLNLPICSLFSHVCSLLHQCIHATLKVHRGTLRRLSPCRITNMVVCAHPAFVAVSSCNNLAPREPCSDSLIRIPTKLRSSVPGQRHPEDSSYTAVPKTYWRTGSLIKD